MHPPPFFIRCPGHDGGFDIMLDAKFQDSPNFPRCYCRTLNTDAGCNEFQHPDRSFAEIDRQGKSFHLVTSHQDTFKISKSISRW